MVCSALKINIGTSPVSVTLLDMKFGRITVDLTTCHLFHQDCWEVRCGAFDVSEIKLRWLRSVSPGSFILLRLLLLHDSRLSTIQ